MKAHTTHFYKVFGLDVESCIPCPELVESNVKPTVQILYGAVPASLPEAEARGARYEAAPGRFLLTVDGIARYLVSKGREITVERAPGASDNEVRLFLLGSVFGALLHQRGCLPLHGSAIEADGQAVVFAGTSGSGKSTLAAALGKRGYPIMSDDVCVVSQDEDDGPMLLPGYPQLKLWANAARKLGEDPSSLRRIRASLEKHGLPVRTGFRVDPLPLRTVYVLDPVNTTDLRIECLEGQDKFAPLIDHTYRLHFLEGLGGKAIHFRQCVSIANRAAVKKIIRPRHPFLLNELADMIEQDMRT